MATTTVTGLTATRQLAMEAATIISGLVNGSGHLILTKFDTTTVDAGLVTGATGATPTDRGVSTTSLAIATGSKTFAVTAMPVAFPVGAIVKAVGATVTNYMVGNVTASSTTSVTINVTEIGGTGTFASWTLTIGAFKGADGVLTGTAGGDLQGAYPNPTLAAAIAAALVPTGTLLPFAGSAAPTGYLLCNGSTTGNRTTHAALFALIGTTYGAGDGSTTFGLPDLRDRQPVGVSATKTLGTTGGAATATLTAANLPRHTHDIGHGHTLNISGTAGTAGSAMRGVVATGTNAAVNDYVGSSGNGDSPISATPTAVSTQDPYAAVNFIIKT